jgi:hypothetical protein
VLDARAVLDRAGAADRALFHGGPDAALRQRYEAATRRELRQTLNELMKHRCARAEFETEAEFEPEETAPAVAEPAPTSETEVANQEGLQSEVRRPLRAREGALRNEPNAPRSESPRVPREPARDASDRSRPTPPRPSEGSATTS